MRPYNPHHHAHMVVWACLRAGGVTWRGVEARRSMVPTIEAALSLAYRRGLDTNEPKRNDMELGMLVALGAVAELHDSPSMARDVAIQLGLVGIDVSLLEDYDKDQLRLLDLPLKGLA